MKKAVKGSTACRSSKEKSALVIAPIYSPTVSAKSWKPGLTSWCGRGGRMHLGSVGWRTTLFSFNTNNNCPIIPNTNKYIDSLLTIMPKYLNVESLFTVMLKCEIIT